MTENLGLTEGLNVGPALFYAGAVLTGAWVGYLSMVVDQLVPAFAKLDVQCSARSWEVLAAAQSGNKEWELLLKVLQCC